MTLDKMTSRLMTGQLTSQDLPSVTSRLIRVFLCSTAVDSCTERTAFVEHVYPKLRQYCRHNYDLEFQMVDMAWGLTTQQICEDTSFSSLKLREILNCQTTSCGPSCLAFIGQKYGPRPLPTSFLAEDYDVVRDALRHNRGRETRNADLIDQWYVIDTNSKPHVYVIKPAADIIPGLNHEDDHVRHSAEERWRETQAELRRLLQKGAQLAFLDGSLESEAKEFFFMSDLERELVVGVENCHEADQRCVMIFRDIVDVKNYVHDPKASTFIDMTLYPQQLSKAHKKEAPDCSLNQPMEESSHQSREDSHKIQHKNKHNNHHKADLVQESSFTQHSVEFTHFSEDAEGDLRSLKNKHKAEEDLPDTSESFVQEVEEDAERQLQGVRERLRAVVPDVNTLRHEVLWRYEDVIHPQLHHDYLKKLCGETCEVFKRLIDECSKRLKDTDPTLPEARQSLDHWTRCRHVTDDVCPCQPQLRQRLRNYVTGMTERPLVVYGVSGCGKTTMVSALAMELPELIGTQQISLIRYIGHGADTTDVRRLLRGLCRHICCGLGHDPRLVPRHFKDLQLFFPGLLAAVPPDTTVVIILDGLEKLSPDHEAHQLQWLPHHLPPHVKVIVTLVPGWHGLLQRLQGDRALKDSPDCFVHVKSLSRDDAELLLRHFLSAVDRQISKNQMEIFLEQFEVCSLPLYVKLMAIEARALHSFTDISDWDWPLDCDEAVERFFDRLERSHGQLVVSRMLGVMMASGGGLSELEMEDVLSLDDVVLRSLLQHHHYHFPLLRVPPAVCIKIRRDIEPFLHVHQVEGVTVTVWDHDSFLQATRGRYLHQPAGVTALHSLLADYFLGTWAGKAKPLEVGVEGEGCGFKPPCGYSNGRLVPPQPHVFVSEHNPALVRFNLRHYSQLPYHLYWSGRQKELYDLVLFSYSWLYNKITAFSLSKCLDDFRLCPTEQTTLVKKALQEAAPIIKADVNNMAAEISGRLLPYYHIHHCIRALIDSCDTDGPQHCALLPNFPYHQVPGSPLQHTIHCPTKPDNIRLAQNDQYVLLKTADQPQVYVVDAVTGDLKDTVFTSHGDLHVTPNCRYFVVMDTLTRKSFKVHHSGTGAFLHHIILMTHLPDDVSTDHYHAGPFCLSNDRLCAVVDTADLSFLFICAIPTGRVIQRIELQGRGAVCELSPDQQHVVYSQQDQLGLCHVYSLQHQPSVPLPHSPLALTLTGHGRHAVLAFKPNRFMIVDLHQGKNGLGQRPPETQLLPNDDVITKLRASRDHCHVMLMTDCHVTVFHLETKQMLANFSRPKQVPKEFRLPRTPYRDLVFTDADFSADSQCIMATIFCHIFIWRLSDAALLSSIQAPIGVISTLLVSKSNTQLLTHSAGSSQVHVWHNWLSTATTTHSDNTTQPQVAPTTQGNDNLTTQLQAAPTTHRDKLTAPIQRHLVSRDASLVLVLCDASDEVGVFDMRTGRLVDLLTHACQVVDAAITPTGDRVLVVTKPRLSGTACLLWDIPQRKVIKEWGSSTGYCLSLHNTDTLLFFPQPLSPTTTYRPFTLTTIHFNTATTSSNKGNTTNKGNDNNFIFKEHEAVCQDVRARPVVTYDDRFVVAMSALAFDSSNSQFPAPCLLAFDLSAGLRRTCFEARNVGMEEVIEDIVQVESCPLRKSCVALVVSFKDGPSSPLSCEDGGSRTCESQDGGCRKIGVLILDISQTWLLKMALLQPEPDLPFPPRLLFSPDFSLCMDNLSCLHNLADNTLLDRLPPPHPHTPPACLAIHGTAVVYFKDCTLFVLRLLDFRLTARCHVHAPICHVTVCQDQRTLLIGCENGMLASYVILDPIIDCDPAHVVASIRSRQPEADTKPCRKWDVVEGSSAPAYSRPPSALSSETDKDQESLQAVRPLARFPPNPSPCKCVRRIYRDPLDRFGKDRWEKIKKVKVTFRI